MQMICRRCLLADMEDQRPLQALMREWLEAMPEEGRSAPEIYEARLAACRDCGWLANGLCGLCGCYVELRAAKARMRCPDMRARW